MAERTILEWRKMGRRWINSLWRVHEGELQRIGPMKCVDDDDAKSKAQRLQDVLDGLPTLDRETLDAIENDVVAASVRTLVGDSRYSHWTAKVIASSMTSAILVHLGERS